MDDLKFIKKHYGEKLMHVCRELFPTILEEEGVLASIISSRFAKTKSLGVDVQAHKTQFKDFIYDEYYRLMEKKEAEKEKQTSQEELQSPFELMDSAGYILFPECKTEADIQRFRHYYKRDDGRVITHYNPSKTPEVFNGEEICTFNGGRLSDCRVWFAVRKDVDSIKREDYPLPRDAEFDAKKDEYALAFGKEKWEELTSAEQKTALRDGVYGTSVISIQVSKRGKPTVSIKNRYNHHLPKGTNPDATFGNNLDNIVPGLTDSFAENFGIDLSHQKLFSRINLPHYVLANNGKMYRFNKEINGTYYCENNVIIEFGAVTELDESRYIVTETGDVFDLHDKSICRYDRNSYLDRVSESADDVTVKPNKDGSRVVSFFYNGTERTRFTLDEHNCVIGLTNLSIRSLSDRFFKKYSNLKHLNLPNLQVIKKYYNESCESLVSFRAEKLEVMELGAMKEAKNLVEFYAPSLIRMEGENLFKANKLKEFNAPNLVHLGIHSLEYVNSLTSFSAPHITSMYENLTKAKSLTNFYAPQVETMTFCLQSVDSLSNFYAPNLTYLKGSLYNINSLKRFYAPNLTRTAIFVPPVYEEMDEFVVSPVLAKRFCVPIKTFPEVETQGKEKADQFLTASGPGVTASEQEINQDSSNSEDNLKPSLVEEIKESILATKSNDLDNALRGEISLSAESLGQTGTEVQEPDSQEQ